MLFAYDEIYNGFALKYCGHSVSKVRIDSEVTVVVKL